MFEEAIALVKGRAGIFPEPKSPARPNARGADVEQAPAGMLAKHGLTDAKVKGPLAAPAVPPGEERPPAWRRCCRRYRDAPGRRKGGGAGRPRTAGAR